MNGLALHLRARHTPAAAGLAIGVTGLVWLGWNAFSDAGRIGEKVASVTVALACAIVSVTLARYDESLEESGARPWSRVRGLHLLTAFVLLSCLFTAFAATPVDFGPADFLVRDTAGLLGLAAFGAAALGPSRAWFGPVLISVVGAVWGGATDSHVLQVLTWMTQPADTTAASVTAAVLALSGTVAHMRGRVFAQTRE